MFEDPHHQEYLWSSAKSLSSIVAIPNILIHKFVLPPILTNLDNDIAFEIQGNMDLDLQNNTLNFQTKIKI